MTRLSVLTLALVSLGGAGCYESHLRSGATEDGGPRPDALVTDAAMCRPIPSNVGGLTCPALVAPGDPVLVTVQHAPGGCCGEDAAQLVARRTGPRAFALDASFDSCGCCELCDCVGPTVRQALDLGPLEEGTWTVVADAARGFVCTIEVRASECRQQDITNAIAPTAVRLGERVPVLMRAPGLSCGCTPRGFFRFGREGGTFVGLEACGCSDIDPCVDAGYEATALVEGGDTLGAWRAMTSAGPVATQLVRPDACVPGPFVRAIEPLCVDEDMTHDMPIRVFARVDYDAVFCCGEPLPVAIERFTGDPGARTYELQDCLGIDCACDPGPPRPLTAIVYLGEFPPGAQRVQIGGVATTIVVPTR